MQPNDKFVMLRFHNSMVLDSQITPRTTSKTELMFFQLEVGRKSLKPIHVHCSLFSLFNTHVSILFCNDKTKLCN